MITQTLKISLSRQNQYIKLNLVQFRNSVSFNTPFHGGLITSLCIQRSLVKLRASSPYGSPSAAIIPCDVTILPARGHVIPKNTSK